MTSLLSYRFAASVWQLGLVCQVVLMNAGSGHLGCVPLEHLLFTSVMMFACGGAIRVGLQARRGCQHGLIYGKPSWRRVSRALGVTSSPVWLPCSGSAAANAKAVALTCMRLGKRISGYEKSHHFQFYSEQLLGSVWCILSQGIDGQTVPFVGYLWALGRVIIISRM